MRTGDKGKWERVKDDFRNRILTEVAPVKCPANRWKNESELRMRKGGTN